MVKIGEEKSQESDLSGSGSVFEEIETKAKEDSQSPQMGENA